MNKKPTYEQLEKKIAEYELELAEVRENEKRFKDVTHSMADWAWEIDKSGKYTFVSGNTNYILGYEADEIIGKTPFDFMPDDEAVRVRRIFEKIAADKKPIVNLENLNVGKKGHMITLLTNGVPFFDKNEELVGYRGVDKDITFRKMAEKALQDNEKMTRDLLNLPIASILMLDRDGIILDCNETMAARFQKTISKLVGTCFWELIPKEVAQQRKIYFKKAIKKGCTVRWEDQREGYWFDNLFRPILEADQNITKIIACGIDITEQHRQREVIEQKQLMLENHAKKLEQMNTALNVLIDHRENEKKNVKEDMIAAFNKLVFPYFDMPIRSKSVDEIATILAILKQNIQEILLNKEKKAFVGFNQFTPLESQVATLIKENKGSKEIAKILNISIRAVYFHRNNIRKKLRLTNQKNNLKTVLQSI